MAETKAGMLGSNMNRHMDLIVLALTILFSKIARNKQYEVSHGNRGAFYCASHAQLTISSVVSLGHSALSGGLPSDRLTSKRKIHEQRTFAADASISTIHLATSVRNQPVINCD
jgi:hypothetical protein